MIKKIFKILLIVAIIGSVIATFYFLWKKSQPKVVVYELLDVKRDTLETKTLATGKIEPRDEVLIKPQISGIISEVLKEPGQMVRSGEIIAKIKVIPEMVQLNSAESRIKVAEINFNQIQQTYDRQKGLFDKGVIAKEEMEKAEADIKKAKEEVDNAKDAYDIIRDGISKKSASLSTTQVRSTIDGMILDIPVKAGNSVIQSNNFNDGTTIASIANMNDMIFKGKVDETEVGKIKEDMPIILTIGALDTKRFDATLEYIAPKGVEENGAVLFEVKAAARIPEGVFVRAGYSANAEIVLNKVENVLAVPESAIEFKGDSAFVNVLTSADPAQEFKKQPVKLGLSDGINIEVIEGLKEGEKVRGNVAEEK